MKFLFLVLNFVFVQRAFSETHYCSGNTYLPSAYVYMHCNSGYCSGNATPQFISASGTCTNGITYSATGYLKRPTIYGSCTNGYFTTSIIGTNVDWNGTCSDGEFAANFEYFPSETVYESCKDNGTFFLHLNSTNVGLTATCSVN